MLFIIAFTCSILMYVGFVGTLLFIALTHVANTAMNDAEHEPLFAEELPDVNAKHLYVDVNGKLHEAFTHPA